MRCVTTAGILATFGAIGGGIYTAFYMAAIAANDCERQLGLYLQGITNGTLAIPEFNFNVSTTLANLTLPFSVPAFKTNATTALPAMTVPLDIFGQTFNATIPDGHNISLPVDVPAQNLNVLLPTLNLTLPVHVPSMTVRASDILGKSLIQAANELPDTAGDICHRVTLMTVLNYTAMAAFLFATLTYAYQSNAALRHRMEDGFNRFRTFRRSPASSPAPAAQTAAQEGDVELATRRIR